MSLLSSIPTVNILMTTDPQHIQTFLSTRNLVDFSKKMDEDSNQNKDELFVFRNGPASMFLGLTHESNFKGGRVGFSAPEMVLRFADPEGTFEERLVDFSLEGLMPAKTNLYLIHKAKEEIDEKINQLEDEAIKQRAIDLISGKDITENQKLFQQQIDNLELQHTGYQDALDSTTPTLDLQNLTKLFDNTKALTKKPVWITYGIGNDLSEWSPPCCYAHMSGASYEFTGKGARILALKYDGVGIHPEVGGGSRFSQPLNSLGTLGGGIHLRIGSSRKLFNEEENKAREEKYKKLSDLGNFSTGYQKRIDKRLNKYFHDGMGNQTYAFSMHQTIVDTFTSLVKSCTNYNNIIVALPDMDLALGSYWVNLYKRIIAAAAAEPNVGAAKAPPGKFGGPLNKYAEAITESAIQLFQSMGFGIQTENPARGGKLLVASPTPGGLSTLPVQPIPNLLQKLDVSAVTTLADSMYWINKEGLRVSLYGMGNETNLVDLLYRVLNKVTGVVSNYPIGQPFVKSAPAAVQEFQGATFIETDVAMLELWHKNGLIANPNEPAVVVGETTFINNILYGRVFSLLPYDSEPGEPSDGSYLETVSDYVHEYATLSLAINPLTALLGINDKYFADLQELNKRKDNRSRGSFGDMISAEINELKFEDDNVMAIVEDKKKLSKLPLFAMGLTNSNILSVDFNINTHYFHWLNSFNYGVNHAAMILSAFLNHKQTIDMTFNILKGVGGSTLSTIGPVDPGDITSLLSKAQGQKIVDMLKPYYNAAAGSVEAVTSSHWKNAIAVLTGSDQGDIDEVLFWGTPTYPQGGALAPVPVGVGPPAPLAARSEAMFITLVWNLLCALQFKYARSTILIDSPNLEHGIYSHTTRLLDLAGRTGIMGTIKTLPHFWLSNAHTTIQREALLYIVEPSFSAQKALSSLEHTKKFSWYSGLYIIRGFKHTITAKTVDSQFRVYKNPRPGTAV